MALFAMLTACSSQSLSFTVIGRCTSDAGTLTSIGRGFTPNGTYTTEVTYPNGDPYVAIDNPGTAAADGSTPNWKWPCAMGANGKGDPPGEYKVKITDNSTGRSVNTTFTVYEP